GGVIPNGGFMLRDVNTDLPQNWQFHQVSADMITSQNTDAGVRLLASKSGGEIESGLFEFPITGTHQFTIQYMDAKSISAIHGQIQYYDIFHHPLSVQPITINVT